MNVKILGFSVRAVTWLKYHKVINPDNPLMFTCLSCNMTSHDHPTGHEPKCRNLLLAQLGVPLSEEEEADSNNPLFAEALQVKLNEIAFGKESEDEEETQNDDTE
jgi:hypothetical protein